MGPIKILRLLLLTIVFLLFAEAAAAQEEILTESNNIRIDPEWIKAIGAGSNSSVYDIKTARDGNIYMTGYFSRSLHYKQQNLYPKCKDGDCSNFFFLSKLNRQGKLLWLRFARGTSRPARLAFDSNGFIYVAGTVWSKSLRFTSEDTITVKLDKPDGSNSGIFICKYSPSGQLLQTSFHQDVHPQEATDLFLDKQDNLYVAGRFHYRSSDRNEEVRRSFLLLKFSNKGKLLWQQKGDTVGSSGVNAVYVHKGLIYVTGSYGQELRLGKRKLKSDYSTNRAFVARFDQKGKLLWLTDSIGNSNGVSGTDIGCDANGNPYVYGGTLTSDLFLARLNKQGKPVWVQTTKGLPQYPQQMLLDESNNIYLCGQGYSAEFGSSGPNRFSYKTNGGIDLFLASYSTKGELRWLKAGGGSGNNYCRAIALYKNSLIAAGAHNELLQFRDTTLNAYGHDTFWLAKFDRKKLEIFDTSPEEPPKPDKNGITVNPATCACTQVPENKNIAPARLNSLLSYEDFADLSRWLGQGTDSLYNELFYYDFQASGDREVSFYNLTLLAHEPVRLLHPDRSFGLNLTPCRTSSKSYELPMHLDYRPHLRNQRPDFNYNTFDHSARSWFYLLADVAKLTDEMILRKVLFAEFVLVPKVQQNELRRPDLDKFAASVNKRYNTSIKITPEDREGTLQNFLKELKRKKISVTDFVLREYILTSPESTERINALETFLLERFFSEWFRSTLADIEYNLLQPHVRARFKITKIGFEVGDKIIRRRDTSKNGLATSSKGLSESPIILLKVPDLGYHNFSGLGAAIKSVCLSPAEITGTSIQFNFSQAQLLGAAVRQYGQLEFSYYPLFITDSVFTRNSWTHPYRYSYKYDTLLTGFTGLYIPEAFFHFPFKGQALTVTGKHLLLNNQLLTGIMEIPVVAEHPGQPGKVNIAVGKATETVSLQELKAHLVQLGLKQVKVVQERGLVKVYFRKE